MSDRAWFAGAVFFYGLSALYAIFLWRDGFRHHHRINFLLLFLGFLLHTWAMVQRGFSFSRCPINNLYEATIFIAWPMAALALVLGMWSRWRFLGAFASPVLLCIGVFALMPGLDVTHTHEHLVNGLRSMHAALTLLACGGFGLSAVASLMFLTQEHNLKFNKLRAVAALLPSIQRLERVAAVLLWVAFGLLTWGMITGSLWLKQLKGVYFKQDPFIVWTVLIWFFYLGLLLLHGKFGYRGRVFARNAVGGFLFLILTFWGFYLLSPVHHL